MSHHDLKIWPQYYRPVAARQKLFEVRKNDRGFQAGDTVTLREWDPTEVEKREVLGGGLTTDYWMEPLGFTGKKAGPFLIGYVMPIDAERVVFSLCDLIGATENKQGETNEQTNTAT